MDFAALFANKSVEMKANINSRLSGSAYIDKLAKTLMGILHCVSSMVWCRGCDGVESNPSDWS